MYMTPDCMASMSKNIMQQDSPDFLKSDPSVAFTWPLTVTVYSSLKNILAQEMMNAHTYKSTEYERAEHIKQPNRITCILNHGCQQM